MKTSILMHRIFSSQSADQCGRDELPDRRVYQRACRSIRGEFELDAKSG